MAINFPVPSAVGEIFTPIKGLNYRWDGTLWQTIPSANTALPFNYLVNPSFEISQENGNTQVYTADYSADQWMGSFYADPAVGSSQRQAVASPNGSPSTMRVDVLIGSGGPLVDNQYIAILQWLEGRRVAAFRWGTAGALPVVVRFWIKSSIAGTFGIAFRNHNDTRGIGYPYTISAGEVNTWVERSIAITPDTSPTWRYTEEMAMNFWFTFANGGPSLAGAPGVWTAANIIAPTGMTNGAATVCNFQLADVGLYLDPFGTGVAPRWEATPEGQALMDSQRYWYPCRNTRGLSVAQYQSRGRALNPVPMRTTPSVSVGAVGGHPLYAWDYVSSAVISSLGNYSMITMIEIDGVTNGNFTNIGFINQCLSEYPGYYAVSARM